MKLTLIFLFVIFGLGIKDANNSKVYSSTGHSQFSELVMVDEDACIIKDVSDEFIDNELKDLKWKLFGTREKVLNDEEDATFVSNTIFSRSNKTREAYTFTYDTSKIVYTALSVTTKGSINTKGVFKMKSKEITVVGDFGGEKKQEDSTKDVENGKLSVVIYPNKMITLRIVGKAKVTNGVMKKFIFGICSKKGAYEVVTVTSTCYELLEEDANA